METFVDMAREKASAPLLAAGLGLGAVVLSGCGAGEPEPGTPPEADSITYVLLDDVLNSAGEPVECVYMNSSGSHPADVTEDNPWAFAALACDFEGVADFTSVVVGPLQD